MHYQGSYANAAEVKEKIGAVEGLPKDVADFAAAVAARLEASIKGEQPHFFEGNADAHQPPHEFRVVVSSDANQTLVHVFPAPKG